MPQENDLPHTVTNYTACEVVRFFTSIVSKDFIRKTENMKVINDIVINYLLDDVATMDVTDAEYKELITVLLTLMTNIDECFLADGSVDTTSSLHKLINDLAVVVIQLSSTPRLNINSKLSVHDLIFHLNIHFQNFLIKPVSQDTYYFPLASILCQLDQLESSGFNGRTDIVSSLITSLVSVHGDDTCSLISAMRRLTVWHLWFNDEDHLPTSPMDKWIIGLFCEILKRVCYYSVSGDSCIPSTWSDLLNDQLQFVFQLVKRQQIPCSSVLNTLSFLLLIGGFEVKNMQSVCIVEELSQILLNLVSLQRQGRLRSSADVVLLKMARIVKLVGLSACKFSKSRDPQQTDLDRLPIKLKDLTLKIIAAYNEPHCIDVYSNVLHAYDLSNLIAWGSCAGVKLRERWKQLDRKSPVPEINTVSSYFPYVFLAYLTLSLYCFTRLSIYHLQVTHNNRSTFSGRSRDQQHRGLVNIGNTCYANAALQLLYHCLDFRLAVLTKTTSVNKVADSEELPSTSVHRGGGASHTTTSSSPSVCSVEQTNSWVSSASASASGPLHAQLLALFRSLQDAHFVGPPVRDAGPVLVLSKPSHFITGEQQDAVEYLHHLLERLHEEEMEALRHCSESRSPVPTASTGANAVSQRHPTTTTTDTACPSPDGDHPGQQEQNEHSSSCIIASGSNANRQRQLSLVQGLFGGTLVRHTYCTECKHVSSSQQERFQCIYLPVSVASGSSGNSSVHQGGAGSTASGTPCATAEQQQEDHGDAPAETRLPKQQHQSPLDASASQSDQPDTVDLTTLIAAHFSQTEHVPVTGQCESCGRETVRARHVRLKHLASHVLICLNLFQFCQTNRTYVKALRRITIPERLLVSLGQPSPPASPRSSSQPPQTLVPAWEHEAEPGPADSSSSMPTVQRKAYRLQGIILHHGTSISCGHYTCLTRVGPQWVAFDDDIAEHTTLEEQVYSTPLTTPYLLLYVQT